MGRPMEVASQYADSENACTHLRRSPIEQPRGNMPDLESEDVLQLYVVHPSLLMTVMLV